MSTQPRSAPGIPSPPLAEGMARVNNLFMAALLWASRNNCECKACVRLRRAAELMEASMEGEI